MKYIGVDPAFRKDGFWVAIIDMQARTIEARKVQDVIEWIAFLNSSESPQPGEAIVCVEDAYLQRVSFDLRGGAAVVARKSRNVGQVQTVSHLAYKAAQAKYGDWAIAISPRTKGVKIKNKALFNALLDTYGLRPKGKIPNNQDFRDAVKIALCGIRLIGASRFQR